MLVEPTISLASASAFVGLIGTTLAKVYPARTPIGYASCQDPTSQSTTVRLSKSKTFIACAPASRFPPPLWTEIDDLNNRVKASGVFRRPALSPPRRTA